jgi:lysophospholipase L1-like esterase
MRKGGTYLATGDSWTWASNTSLTQGSQFYATQIRNAIRQNYGACRLINKGIGGNTSTEMVQNIPWIFNVKADLITIAIGTNDAPNGSVSQTTYQNNLTTIVNAAKQFNPNAIIILCTPGQTLDPSRSPYIQSYRDTMTQVASSFGLPVCHFEQAWDSSQNSTYLESDNIHPNAAGQALIYSLLWSVVQDNASNWLSQLSK